MSIRYLLAASVAAVAFAGTASAATLDFTDNDSYTVKTNATASGTIDGVTWTVTSDPAGQLTYTDFDGKTESPLADDNDGIGVADDEISNIPKEYITVSFSEDVMFTGARFLDLFFEEGQQDQEMVQIWFGTDTSGDADVLFAANKVYQSEAGYFAGEFSWTGDTLTFGVMNGQNDGQGVGDYALAAIDLEVMPIPLPAAGFLLLGGLGGLVAMKRRKK